MQSQPDTTPHPDPAAALAAWLQRIYAIRSGPEIELGLERIRPVFDALAVKPACPVLLVAGTNGKGSVCAYLDAVLRAGGYRVGRYTSPHIHRFNERIVINGLEADDATLIAAFERVEAARVATGELALTFFEYTTLSALVAFSEARLDAWVVEVGLGGRLDATNLLDADCAVITSIGVDHVEFLGDTREAIAFEKAGIFRKDRPAVIAEPDPPQTLLAHAAAVGTPLLRIGQDFGWQKIAEIPSQWRFWLKTANGALSQRHGLPIPALRGSYQLGNATAALAALSVVSERLPLSLGAIKQGLLAVEWPGRFQVLPGRPVTVLDVAHNGHAARALANALGDMAYFPETHGVFAILKDKDMAEVIEALKARIDHWHIAALEGPRAGTVEALAAALLQAGVADRAISRYPDVKSAYAAAQKIAQEGDRIVVFGSFLTVSQIS